MKIKNLLLLVVVCLSMYNCTTDSYVASRNISEAAEQFEIFRRVVFYNSITDTYILTIEAYCSVDTEGNRLAVTIKTDSGYLKHYLGLSDNVTYFSEQILSSKVGTDRYRVIFKPSVILPNVDIR